MTKIKREAIAHYERMIKWAKTQNQTRNPRIGNDMPEEIGESWYSEDCSYCLVNPLCITCPLDTNKWCCDGLWGKLHFAKTWKTWIKYAKKILKYIKDHG